MPVGSALAYRGIPVQSAYCVAKHAIQEFQYSLRTELIHAGSRMRVTMVPLPGVNTPQFDWVRTKRPCLAIAPYQPEVAAHAILFAARSGRKQVAAGFPAMKAILADRIDSPLSTATLPLAAFPASRTWSRSRQDGRRPCARRPQRAWPVRRRGAAVQPQLWTTMHRRAVGLGALALGAGAFLLARWP